MPTVARLGRPNPSSREATAMSEFIAAIFTTEKHRSTKNSSCSLGRILYFGRSRSPVKTTAGVRCLYVTLILVARLSRAPPISGCLYGGGSALLVALALFTEIPRLS